jgi:hypothetical protein
MNDLLKPSQVFQREVAPAYADCLKNPLSERYAKIAAGAVDHHLDWTFIFYVKTERSRLDGLNHAGFRESLFIRCPQLQIMWAIADAAHHRFLKPMQVARAVDTASDAFMEIGDELWIAPMKVPFLPALSTAVEFWRAWLD